MERPAQAASRGARTPACRVETRLDALVSARVPTRQAEARPHRVLFVCIGNACRSQMAEAFARAHGSDVVSAESAGLWPASRIPAITDELMHEKNISLHGRSPKGLDRTGTDFDVIVNMSGEPLPEPVSAAVRKWDVEDPIYLPAERQREIRDQIEALVRDLVAELRG